MRRLVLFLWLTVLAACWGQRAYIVEGTVLGVEEDGTLLVAHEDIPGFMDAMTMPFELADPELANGVVPGHRILARLVIGDDGAKLHEVRVTGTAPLPETKAPDDGAGPVRPGQPLPALEIPVTGGETWTVGAGQPEPTLLTFLYTTCPLPEFCPMVVSRLQAVQAKVSPEVRLLAVTVDPEHDTLEVLSTFAAEVGADADVWRFGRLDPAATEVLALRAALPVFRSDGADEISHGLRWMVLDAEGRLVERYDDNGWPLDRLVQQLTTGAPPAPEGSDGTLSRPSPDETP